MIVRALPCLTAAFVLIGVLTAAPVQAASSNADTAPVSTAKAAKKQKSHSVKFVKNPYQETATERERRLKRECKGMPNAGACLGYAN